MGSHAPATLDRSVVRSRSSSRAYRLRRLSRSATARRQRSSSLASSAVRIRSGRQPLLAGFRLPGHRPLRSWNVLSGLTMAAQPRSNSASTTSSSPTARAPAVAGRLPVAATGRHGLQPVKHLLQFGCQRLHPVHRCVFLDGLPRVGDQHLGACPVVRRRRIAQFGEPALDLVCRRVEFIARFDLPCAVARPRGGWPRPRRASARPRSDRGWTAR